LYLNQKLCFLRLDQTNLWAFLKTSSPTSPQLLFRLHLATVTNPHSQTVRRLQLIFVQASQLTQYNCITDLIRFVPLS
ncbi:unnamed protein product, partial [Arabidopsis halleri]